MDKEKMIPLSVIDALITSVEDFGENYRYNEVIELLEDLKKQAQPSTEPLEQKIKEINELIAWNLTPSCNEAKKKLDELRKLLE